jgi:hypothetical protein
MQGATGIVIDRVAKDDRLASVKFRMILSLLLAAPFAVLALATGDVTGLPDMVRYAVSPGFVFGLHAAPSGSWIGDISTALRIAIAGNEIYYAFLIFLALSWLGRRRRAGGAPDDEVV